MDKKQVLITIVLFGFCVAWVGFAVYGIGQLYTYADRVEMVEVTEELKAKVITLELKVEEYERISKALPVLRQLITPLGWAEVDALAERNRHIPADVAHAHVARAGIAVHALGVGDAIQARVGGLVAVVHVDARQRAADAPAVLTVLYSVTEQTVVT